MDVLTDDALTDDALTDDRPAGGGPTGVADVDALVELRAALGRIAVEDRSGWSGAARVDRALELLGLQERVAAEALRAVGDADRDAAWRAGGALSAATWLAHEARVSRPDAARLVRSARLARDHERTGKALASGEMSVAHVDELGRAVRDREAVFVEHEPVLVDAARTLAPAKFAIVARRWRGYADDVLGNGAPADVFAARRLHVAPTSGGIVVGDFTLDPDTGGRFIAALDALAPPDPGHGTEPARSLAQRRADALGDMADLVLGGAEPSARPRVGIGVLTDVDTLLGLRPGDLLAARSDVEGVGPVAPETVRRLGCDAVLTRMVLAPSRVLDVGRPTKVVPDHLRRAVTARDGGCVFPGCDRPQAWCDVHHVVPRHRGGPTAEHNLVLLCRRHHVACHEGDWNIIRGPDGWTAERAPPPTPGSRRRR
jgi:hypothetical protein